MSPFSPVSVTADEFKDQFPAHRHRRLAENRSDLRVGMDIFMFSCHADPDAAHPGFTGRGKIVWIGEEGVQLEDESFIRTWANVAVPPTRWGGMIYDAVEIIPVLPKKPFFRGIMEWFGNRARSFR